MNLKRPNKRTVCNSDLDPENKSKHQRKRRKNTPAQDSDHIPNQKPESFNSKILNIPVEGLSKKLSQWPYLEIRGPYHNFHFLFNNRTIKNQPLCKLLRQLLIKIHENANDYKKKTIPTIIKRFDKKTPTVDDAITIAEDMCRRVFRFRDGYAYFVNLYEDNMISPIKEMLFGKELNVDCKTKKEILQHLKSICKSKKVTVTYQQLVDVRNSFVNWIFQLAIELLPCIFSIDVVLYPGRLSSYRAAEFSMSENFHEIAEWYSKPPQLRPISYNLMNRRKKTASLWLLIPCELKHHLMEHVMEYGLMELLPKEARSLLSRWIIDVRKRMRNRLTKRDLSNKIGQYMSAVDKNEQLSPDDARIEGVISAVLENALNSKDFKVFDGEWKTFTLNLIKTMDRHQFIDISSRADLIRDVCQNMNPTSLQLLSSCFSNSETDKTLLSHTLHQVLHFTIRFALNTLRHVFCINRQSRFCIRFDGSMEEVVTDFSNYSRNTLPKAKALRQPSVSSFTQIDDFEGLPDEWIIEYKAALDSNTKLLAELDRAKARLDAISK